MDIHNKKISAFQLAMITLAFVSSLRVLPSMAQYGLTSLFYYFIAMLIFLVPSALISAELATTFPERRGGVYVWVREALGPRWGFLAIWLQFFSNIITMPAYLSFIGSAFAYLFAPQLANNPWFLVSFILIVFWTATLISFSGMNTAGWINTFGSVVGTFIPLAAMIALGFYWIASGHHSQVPLSTSAFFPQPSKMHWGDLAFLAAMLYSLCGMETSGAHVLEVDNARRNYPKAMLIAVLFVSFVGFGAVAVAMVIPQAQLSLTAGIMQAFSAFLTQLHLDWLVKLFAFMIFIGAITALNSSVIGPCRGLVGSATDGELPPFLAKLNSRGMPTSLFIMQAVVVSIFSAGFFFMPNINSSYWLIVVIMNIVYLSMYLLLFISAIVLRHKYPNLVRFYQVPGGKVGIWVLGLLGLIGTTIGIVVAFIPPSSLNMGSVSHYEILIAIGCLFSIGLGLLIYHFRRTSWVVNVNAE